MDYFAISMEALKIVVSAAGGFFIKHLLEKRNNKKEAKQKTKKDIKKYNEIISSKIFSIPRDIRMYIHLYETIKKHENDIGYKESSFYKLDFDTKNLCSQRIIEDTNEIIFINTNDFYIEYENVKDVIETMQNNCKNLNKIMINKTDDDMKIELLEKTLKTFEDQYSQLMDLTRDMY
ncbi:hypothetical protein [Luteimonas abyssi]|uniref:hypothetical protein n=1 Tax=Luteimonas abyssi TaxID=1247514 RepID=UPI0012F8EF25|nr:hypothetical protein [Luteimonas abyssi]